MTLCDTTDIRHLDPDGVGGPDDGRGEREAIPREERLNEIFAEHAPSLRRFLHRLTKDRDAVEDLVQETMLRAWRSLDQVPTDDREARRWLYVVARRLVIDSLRRSQARPVTVGVYPDWLAAGDSTIDTALAHHSLIEAFSRLSSDHRLILSELHLRGRSVEETATRLNVPVGTVKSRRHYALAALRSAMR